MGSRLLESALQDAAARVSSAPVGASRGVGGTRSVDDAWEKLRGKMARALVADPDLVTYFAFLVSNRGCALAQKVAAQLSAMAVDVEGWKYKQSEAPSPTRLNRALSTLSGRESVSAEDVARLSAEVSTYIGSELIPRVSRAGRLQTRGTEALSAYQKKRDALVPDWKALRAALAAVSGNREFTSATVRNVALAVPVAALTETAGLLDQERLVDFTVQLAAAGAAVSAMGRDVDLKVRLSTGASVFPAGVSVTPGVSDGVVTSLATSTSPLLLGVRSGDSVISADFKTATVRTVTDAGVTLSDSTITTTAEGVQICSTAYLLWEQLTLDLVDPYAAMPTETQLLDEVRRKEDPSAARIRALMELLCKNAVILDAVSSDATAALERVGGDLYTYEATPVASLLRAFAPSFSTKTKQAGDRLLGELESEGFDYAVELLYSGQVDLLMTLQASQVSRSGRLSDAAATLGTYTGGARGVG